MPWQGFCETVFGLPTAFRSRLQGHPESWWLHRRDILIEAQQTADNKGGIVAGEDSSDVWKMWLAGQRNRSLLHVGAGFRYSFRDLRKQGAWQTSNGFSFH